MADTAATFAAARKRVDADLEQLERQLSTGPYFNGADFSLVDASLAPVLMRFAIMQRDIDLDLYTTRPRLATYRSAVLARPSVVDSVVPEFAELFIEYFREQGGYVAGHLPVSNCATL